MEWEKGDVGLDAALQICSLCPKTRIVLMAEDFNRYIQQIFLKKADLFGFLIKPVEKEILHQYIRKVVADEYKEQDACLLIRSRGVMQSVRCSDILYMESAGHMVMVRTKQEDIYCYGRLGKFLEQLPENFVQCHKSYLVNMREIRRIEQKWIQMDQGTMIPISKSRSQNTKNRFSEYMKRMADA